MLHVRLIVRVVVKLFNAIQQSQAASTAAAEELKTHRGTGKPTLPAPAILDRKKKGKQKDNIIGRGKEGNERVPEAQRCQKGDAMWASSHSRYTHV